MRQLIARPPSRSHGFTLVEVLITVFVTGIGILTVAGLQATAKKVNYEATQRTVASALAQDMVERMRANMNSLLAASVNATNREAYLIADATGITAAPTTCLGDSAACTPAQLAAFDLYQWKQKLLGADMTDSGGGSAGGLLNPTGCITKSGSGSSTKYRVSIAWRGLSAVDQITSTSEPLFDACGNSTSDRYNEAGTTNFNMRRVLFIEFVL